MKTTLVKTTAVMFNLDNLGTIVQKKLKKTCFTPIDFISINKTTVIQKTNHT